MTRIHIYKCQCHENDMHHKDESSHWQVNLQTIVKVNLFKANFPPGSQCDEQKGHGYFGEALAHLGKHIAKLVTLTIIRVAPQVHHLEEYCGNLSREGVNHDWVRRHPLLLNSVKLHESTDHETEETAEEHRKESVKAK